MRLLLKLRAKFHYKMYSILYGRHSNFRWCCVLYYAFLWQDIIYPRWCNEYHSWTRRCYKKDSGCGYVPCPLCAIFQRTPRKVHHCDGVVCDHTFGGPWAAHVRKGDAWKAKWKDAGSKARSNTCAKVSA